MENKIILKVLQRLHSENTNNIRKMIKRADELAHQIMYYGEMLECGQNLVLEGMFNEMKEYGWKDWVKEVKEELKGVKE